jgi:hypothetical protein
MNKTNRNRIILILLVLILGLFIFYQKNERIYLTRFDIRKKTNCRKEQRILWNDSVNGIRLINLDIHCSALDNKWDYYLFFFKNKNFQVRICFPEKYFLCIKNDSIYFTTNIQYSWNRWVYYNGEYEGLKSEFNVNWSRLQIWDTIPMDFDSALINDNLKGIYKFENGELKKKNNLNESGFYYVTEFSIGKFKKYDIRELIEKYNR